MTPSVARNKLYPLMKFGIKFHADPFVLNFQFYFRTFLASLSKFTQWAIDWSFPPNGEKGPIIPKGITIVSKEVISVAIARHLFRNLSIRKSSLIPSRETIFVKTI